MRETSDPKAVRINYAISRYTDTLNVATPWPDREDIVKISRAALTLTLIIVITKAAPAFFLFMLIENNNIVTLLYEIKFYIFCKLYHSYCSSNLGILPY